MTLDATPAVFRLNDYPAGDRFGIWRSILRPLYSVSLPEGIASNDFSGEIAIGLLSDCILFSCASQPQTLDRDVATLRRTSWDHVVVQLNTSGGIVADYGPRRVAAGAGDITLFDLQRPIRIKAGRFSHLALIAPRDRLVEATKPGGNDRGRIVDDRSVHGEIIAKSNVLTQVIASHIRGIAAHAVHLTSAEANVALIALFLMIEKGALRDTEIATRAAAYASLRETVVSYIDDHLGDPMLGPSQIAQACHVSRATLYRLFAGDEGVAAFVMQRRLERAFDMIARPGAPALRIGTVAHRCGYKNDVHFSRAFRRRFKMTPREARMEVAAAGQTPDLVSPQSWVESMRRYRNELGS